MRSVWELFNEYLNEKDLKRRQKKALASGVPPRRKHRKYNTKRKRGHTGQDLDEGMPNDLSNQKMKVGE